MSCTVHSTLRCGAGGHSGTEYCIQIGVQSFRLDWLVWLVERVHGRRVHVSPVYVLENLPDVVLARQHAQLRLQAKHEQNLHPRCRHEAVNFVSFALMKEAEKVVSGRWLLRLFLDYVQAGVQQVNELGRLVLVNVVQACPNQ